jgi:hypothetical protein
MHELVVTLQRKMLGSFLIFGANLFEAHEEKLDQSNYFENDL